MLTVVFDPQELVKAILEIGEEIEEIREAAVNGGGTVKIHEAADIAAGSCDLLAHELGNGEVIGNYIKFKYTTGKGKEDGNVS